MRILTSTAVTSNRLGFRFCAHNDGYRARGRVGVCIGIMSENRIDAYRMTHSDADSTKWNPLRQTFSKNLFWTSTFFRWKIRSNYFLIVTFIHSTIRLYINRFIRSIIHSIIYSFHHSFILSFIHSIIHLSNHSFNQSLFHYIRPFIHLLVHLTFIHIPKYVLIHYFILFSHSIIYSF